MVGFLILAAKLAVLTVFAVHEKVQQRAQEQQHVGQDAEEVRGVLGHEKEEADGEETKQSQTCPRPNPPAHAEFLSAPHRTSFV
jgi:uncharacterized protein YfaQ (DUF2300 family)